MANMIEWTRGDILQADVEALVNTVNCVGVMGRGIALQFRQAFPENYAAYRAACEIHSVRPGQMFIHDLHRFTNPRLIINFPTKRHWKAKSRIEDIESGLDALAEEVASRGIRSIAVPPLGCGLGGLDWRDVRPRIERAFLNMPDVRVLVFEPAGAPRSITVVGDQRSPVMTVGRASLLGLMRRYLAAVMDPTVSLLEIHKLAYFMQEAGEGLRLRYRKGHYGPYAENLRHVLIRLEGHFILGYGDGDDQPGRQIEVLPGAWEKADDVLRDHPETRARFDRVADLIAGFETPFGLELLATVHWLFRREGVTSVEAAIAQVYGWSDRKRMFAPEQIRTAYAVLRDNGWLRTPA